LFLKEFLDRHFAFVDALPLGSSFFVMPCVAFGLFSARLCSLKLWSALQLPRRRGIIANNASKENQSSVCQTMPQKPVYAHSGEHLTDYIISRLVKTWPLKTLWDGWQK